MPLPVMITGEQEFKAKKSVDTKRLPQSRKRVESIQHYMTENNLLFLGMCRLDVVDCRCLGKRIIYTVQSVQHPAQLGTYSAWI